MILIITLLQNPEGVMGAFYKRTHRKQPIVAPEGARAPTVRPSADRPRIDRSAAKPVLSTEGVSVSFGGVRALERRHRSGPARASWSG